MGTQVQVIFPARKMDVLADHLVGLTEAIEGVASELISHGLLGGEHGYGALWDSDIFLMHPFCWCERDDCRWCSEDACGCPNPSPLHFIDDAPVSPDEFWRRNKELLGPMPHEVAKYGTPKYRDYTAQWDARVKERDRRWKTIYQARHHCCDPQGLMADREEGLTWKPNQTAPNFWHKSSGIKVWWYKYIGRDQEAIGPTNPDLKTIFAECLDEVARIGSEATKTHASQASGMNTLRISNPITGGEP